MANSNGEQPGDRTMLVKRAMLHEQRGERLAALEVYRFLGNLPDPSVGLDRIVTGGLTRLGDVEGAVAVDRRSRDRRAAALPDTIEQALDAVWGRIESVEVNPVALDWAWDRRDRSLGYDREEYERRAKWGIEAERVTLAWLELKPDDRSARSLFIEGDEYCNALSKKHPGEPELIVSSHVGPLFANMLFYHVFETGNRYIGNFAPVPGSPLSARLLVTQGQKRDSIRRAARDALKRGHSVGHTVDANGAAPLVRGDDGDPPIRISSLLFRLAYRTGLPLSFNSRRWEDARIRLIQNPMGTQDDTESEEDFVARVSREARQRILDQFENNKPENLRLHRGVWRDIVRAAS